MPRYLSTIAVRVAYYADNPRDARAVAVGIENTISFPTPLGRNAELVSVTVRSTIEDKS